MNKAMKKGILAVLLVFVVFTATGCGNSIVGSWTNTSFDVETALRFDSNGTVSVSWLGNEAAVGVYKVSGNQITLSSSGSLAGAGLSSGASTFSISGDRLTLNGMVFSRKKDIPTADNGAATQAPAVGTAEDSRPQASSLPDAARIAGAQSEAVEVSDGENEARQRLSLFMDAWEDKRFEEMINHIQPSWRVRQADPISELFHIVSNRTPVAYAIESISGAGDGASFSVAMTATIDKNNGDNLVQQQLIIIMDRQGGEWFVDPDSLFVTLYYNPQGGRYYHADPECGAVNQKYLPMASFSYSELNEERYSALMPCLKCNAPAR